MRDRCILSGNSKILHIFSEDILTANVFGVLKNLNPKVWLSSFLKNGCNFSTEEFPFLYDDDNFSSSSISLWMDLDEPPSELEGITQADVFIELKNAAVLIECKVFAPLQKHVSTDRFETNPIFRWNQAIRNIVRGYAYVRRRFRDKDFFFVVLSMSEKEETFSQYENWARIRDQVEKRITKDPDLRRFFPAGSVDAICGKLSRQIRWAKWADLKAVLQACDFGESREFKPQSLFRDDLVKYLDLKTELYGA